MKCIDTCCHRSGYVTPWCRMLSEEKESDCSVLHLWYKSASLQRDIERRSAKLGQFRRTEESQHLLDLINMTTDEEPFFYTFARAAMADVFRAFSQYAPKFHKAYFWREGLTTVTLPDIDDPSYDPEEPTIFKKDDYVLYDDMLYMAIEDGDSNDFDGKLIPTEDYRDSIHYAIRWKCSHNINMIEPLDTAISEALVARIIYKWLKYSYPDEAPSYLNEYMENLDAIRDFCRDLFNDKIVRRIPRIF